MGHLAIAPFGLERMKDGSLALAPIGLVHAGDAVDVLRHAIETLRVAIEHYDHPEEEAQATQAAVGVQNAMNTLLDANAVVFDGLIRLGNGKAGALLKINGGMPLLTELLRRA